MRRERQQRNLTRGARGWVAATARRVLPRGAKGRNTLLALAGDTADAIAQSAVWTDHADFPSVSSWLARRLPEQSPLLWRRSLVEPARGVPGAAMAADFRSYLPEDILVKVDRASMLLDSRVIDFAFQRVPNHLRVTPRDRKILLKSLARRLLPPDLDIDRKQGFTIPISQWLNPKIIEGWRDDCREQIRSILSESAVSQLVKPRRNLAGEHGLYAAIMLTSWMRQYAVSIS